MSQQLQPQPRHQRSTQPPLTAQLQVLLLLLLKHTMRLLLHTLLVRLLHTALLQHTLLLLQHTQLLHMLLRQRRHPIPLPPTLPQRHIKLLPHITRQQPTLLPRMQLHLLARIVKKVLLLELQWLGLELG
jgi:hypothetical protein